MHIFYDLPFLICTISNSIISMEILEYNKIKEFLEKGVIPSEVRTKSVRQSFKRRASSYQLGDGNMLCKVSYILQGVKTLRYNNDCVMLILKIKMSDDVYSLKFYMTSIRFTNQTELNVCCAVQNQTKYRISLNSTMTQNIVE